MNSTTLSFANLHNHGALFANVLHARRESFITKNRWGLPGLMGMEYDQYDTPQSRWLAVHDDTGHVLAGVRLTPTTAQCGIYSYMIRDAQCGRLDNIPTNLLYDQAPVDETTWEVTRGFVANECPSYLRQRVRMHLVRQMMRTSREEGITKMLALLPSNWNRWGNRCKLDMQPAGPNVDLSGNAHQAVWMDFSNQLH